MNVRLIGWISLFLLLLMAACGPPEVHDINGGGGGISDDDDDAGDDDDDAATTFPTATTPPGAAPTLTNVPSFATWNSSIRPLMCSQCHTGASGGLTFGTQTDASSLKYFWFESICNQNDPMAPTAGTQSYNPPTGRYQRYMGGNVTGSPTGHPNPGNNSATITSWMNQGAASTPPSCNDYYDLANSS